MLKNSSGDKFEAGSGTSAAACTPRYIWQRREYGSVAPAFLSNSSLSLNKIIRKNLPSSGLSKPIYPRLPVSVSVSSPKSLVLLSYNAMIVHFGSSCSITLNFFYKYSYKSIQTGNRVSHASSCNIQMEWLFSFEVRRGNYQLARFTPGMFPAIACTLNWYLLILKSLRTPRPWPPMIQRLRICVGRV